MAWPMTWFRELARPSGGLRISMDRDELAFALSDPAPMKIVQPPHRPDADEASQAATVLAALLYIRRVTTTTTIARVTPEYIAHGRAHSLQLHDVPDNVAIYRIHGPFLFGPRTSWWNSSTTSRDSPRWSSCVCAT